MRGRIKKQGRASFCEQKEAEKLCSSGPVWFQHLRPKPTEVFAPLFSKSDSLLSFKHR
jgi:hypothetical protein